MRAGTVAGWPAADIGQTDAGVEGCGPRPGSPPDRAQVWVAVGRPKPAGARSGLNFEREDIELRLEFIGDGLVEAFHGGGKSWSANVAFTGDAVPAPIMELIPLAAT